MKKKRNKDISQERIPEVIQHRGFFISALLCRRIFIHLYSSFDEEIEDRSSIDDFQFEISIAFYRAKK